MFPRWLVRWAGKIESRFSRVLRHDDAENALSCRDLNRTPGTKWRFAVRLALYEPDIPQNVGSLMRLGACLGWGST